ncbi:nucleotidyltransferase family protein, partial [Acinetobacter baumannii]
PSGQHIELHFNLIEDHRIKGASAILNRVWDAAVPCGGWTYQYEMPDELFYFYHIAHMAKHVENGGCGIRPFLDIWVLMHYV